MAHCASRNHIYVSLTIGEIHEGCKGGGGGNEQQQNCASGEL